MEARSGGRANVGTAPRSLGPRQAVLIRRGAVERRARDKTSIFGSRAAKPRTVMSADGTAAANWLRGGVKAVTREYDALPMHYLSAS